MGITSLKTQTGKMHTQFMIALPVGRDLRRRREEKKLQLCQVYLKWFFLNNPVEANRSKYSYLDLFSSFF